MGMDLTTYIGPYLIVPKGFDWCEWDNIVCDGRGEAGVGEDRVILVPNQKLEGVTRSMRVDRTGEQEQTQINPAMIVRETAAFVRLAKPVIDWCDERDIEIHEAWGIVPCWS
jgi:hypothetical protein